MERFFLVSIETEDERSMESEIRANLDAWIPGLKSIAVKEVDLYG